MANLIRKRENEPSAVERFDPFRMVRDLLRFDPLGRDLLSWDPLATIEPAALRGPAVFIPSVDVKETPDAFILQVDLPGVRDEDVEITLSGNRVTISGTRAAESRREDDRYFAYERSYGTFSRAFALPEDVDPDKAKAELNEGVLTLTVPKRQASQSRRIAVGGKGEGAERRQMTGAGSAEATAASGTEATAAAGMEGAGKEKEKEEGRRKAA